MGASSDGLDAYKILQCLTKGQMSEVYQAMHTDTGTMVAIKRVKIFDLHPSTRQECETEVEMLKALDHAHLIRYYTHFMHEEDLYVVMEHAVGGTLAQKVDAARRTQKSIEEKLLWRWLYDVASALAYMHERRVLHRDVKPSHIFLGEGDLEAKLGDFGLSKAMSMKTQCAFSCVGTPFYMSPEIVKGDGYSFGSDVWSLACTWYELAMGYPPFFRQDMDFYALGDAICAARYPALPAEAWSKDFRDFLSETLVVSPASRPDAQGLLNIASRQACRMAETMASLKDFKVLSTIGRGKFSEVHRCLWQQSGSGAESEREVALKRVQIFDMDSEARRVCDAEVNLLKTLEHPTIIKYLDSFVEPPELVIVLELAPHGDLAHMVRLFKHEQRSLQEVQIWAVFLQVSDAINYMHEHRVMHRDIKPANIFMCSRGVVKLGDLGLGRFFSSNTQVAHSFVGTPFYMSPEVISNCEGYDFKSDIWSLGCVLYELSVLVSPFASTRLNYYTLGNKIRAGDYPPLPEATSLAVRGLCEGMLQVRCDARLDAPAVLEASQKAFSQADRASSQSATLAAPREDFSKEDLPVLLGRAAHIVEGIDMAMGKGADTKPPAASQATTPAPSPETTKNRFRRASNPAALELEQVVLKSKSHPSTATAGPHSAPAKLNEAGGGGGLHFHATLSAGLPSAATAAAAASGSLVASPRIFLAQSTPLPGLPPAAALQPAQSQLSQSQATGPSQQLQGGLQSQSQSQQQSSSSQQNSRSGGYTSEDMLDDRLRRAREQALKAQAPRGPSSAAANAALAAAYGVAANMPSVRAPPYPPPAKRGALPPPLTPREAAREAATAAGNTSGSYGGLHSSLGASAANALHHSLPRGAPSGRQAGGSSVGAGAAGGSSGGSQCDTGRRPNAMPSGSLSARAGSRDRDRHHAHLGSSLHATATRRAHSPSSLQVSPLRLAGQLAGGSHSSVQASGGGLPPLVLPGGGTGVLSQQSARTARDSRE
eukprot:TRINITY_DN100966_c0_g1_i1.p1 TRINITY_DN100966_c0_g1~~TRINITY_DN100966_c0_g1_i1.p1  ORF type:complete len:996 (-),score=227.64 TRINITY_DN100966_c0_g1_i1:9-2996(-)